MERASRTRSSGPPNATSVHTWCLALTRRNPDQVEEQCKDPQLMHCGLEKCVAADGSVEWVAAHSKVRLDPHLPPIAHTAPVPHTRVAARLPPTRRNASSARAPSASFGTSTAWKSLQTRTRWNQAPG